MIRELHAGESGLAFAATQALRPHVVDAQAFARRIDEDQRPQGYRLFAVFQDDGTVGAVAGFRILESLAWGRTLYVDDLSTRPDARRRGYARALLDALVAEGRRLGCDGVHLDSGVGPDRADAHRLYLNCAMRISSHHFSREL